MSFAPSVEVLDTILLSREADATQLAGGLLMQFRRLASLKRMLADNYPSGGRLPEAAHLQQAQPEDLQGRLRRLWPG